MSGTAAGHVFRETASGSFPFSAFSWRGLAVEGFPEWRASAAVSDFDSSRDCTSFAGGFCYRDSATLFSVVCRNRFILWQCRGSSLYLLELSLDAGLTRAALRLDMRDGSVLLPGVNVQEEVGMSGVVVLFATTSAVFRLILPHPGMISKNPALTGGLQTSILASAQPDYLHGSNIAALFGQHSAAQPVSMVAGWVSQEGPTIFALASPSGSIHLIQLPPPRTRGLPIRSELKQSSVIHRLWTSFIPAAIRGSGDAVDAPVSLALHNFGMNVIVLALCRDVHLRLWSVEPPECIMTCDLEEYILSEMEENFSATKLVLRKAVGETPSSLRFAVYIETGSTCQVSVFQLLAMEKQLHLSHTYSCPCKHDVELVDLQVSDTEVWGVWKGEAEGETVLQHTMYDGEGCYVWQDAHISSHPPRDIVVGPTSEPRTVFLEALLHPGRFSTAAINKALRLYGCLANVNSLQELRKEATIRVEQELLSSAESTELPHKEFRELQIKCWSKFYGCCYQYHQLMSQPVGVFLDPSSGLVCLFKDDMLSFVYPATPADCLALERPLAFHNFPSEDIARLMEALQIISNQLNPEALESLVSSDEPATVAAKLVAALVDQSASENIMALVQKRLDCVLCLSDALKGIHEAMDYSNMDTSCEELLGTDLQLVFSQFFSSSLCHKILVASLRETCLTRMALARDVLLLLSLLQHTKCPHGDPSYVDQFSSLLLSYRCLHWLCCRHTHPASLSSLESNMRHLASLNISASSRHPPSSIAEDSVLEQYLRSVGGTPFLSALLRIRSVEDNAGFLWRKLLPESISIILAQLWPSTNSVAVCQFLLSICQHTHLQNYVTQVGPLVHEGQYSLHFLLGQSYLTTGELGKAEDHFIRSANGLSDNSESLLQCVVRERKGRAEEGREDGEEEGEGREEEMEEEEGYGNQRLRYFLKVIRLFEQVPSPLSVVSIAEMAVQDMHVEDPLCVVIWSALFKYHLELDHYESAYKAMIANPDPVRRKECLRHFVVVLTELRQLKFLCHLTYPGMEEEVEKVIEDRARSVDVWKHRYYDLLYCFHTVRQNYRKAASVMYEYGLRLGRETPGHKSLQKQADCYCICLTALRLVDQEYAWVVVPVELGEMLAQSTKKSLSRKRPHPAHQVPQQQVEVRTIPDIEKEYILAKMKLSFLKKEPTMASQMCSPFVGPEEVVVRLVQVGLFDQAVDAALQFDLPLDSTLEALASRCVNLSVNVVNFRDGMGDVSSWNWLGLNESADTPTPAEKTVADKAWIMLKSYLETYDPSSNYQLQKCVTKKLLSLDFTLPHWLVQKYKQTNPAELLMLYLTYDLLKEAAHLALDYIDAVLGPLKEDFAMETTLHASSPSVWLPYLALDHLQAALEETQPDNDLAKLSSHLSSKLDDYFSTAAEVTSNKEHHEWQRALATS